MPLAVIDRGPLSSALPPRLTARFKTPRPMGPPPAKTPLSSSSSALPRLMATLPKSLPPSSPACAITFVPMPSGLGKPIPAMARLRVPLVDACEPLPPARARLRAPTDVAKVLAPVAIAKFNNPLAVASVPSPIPIAKPPRLLVQPVPKLNPLNDTHVALAVPTPPSDAAATTPDATAPHSRPLANLFFGISHSVLIRCASH